MQQTLYLILFIMAIHMAGCSGGDSQRKAQTQASAAFDETMHEADSLYNSMQFRDAYDIYLQLLDNKEAKADNEKMLNVLNSLCMASEFADHKMSRPN